MFEFDKETLPKKSNLNSVKAIDDSDLVKFDALDGINIKAINPPANFKGNLKDY